MIDLEKLTPAPWEAKPSARSWDAPTLYRIFHDQPGRIEQVGNDTDIVFHALARNAFDGDSEALAWWEANRRKR